MVAVELVPDEIVRLLRHPGVRARTGRHVKEAATEAREPAATGRVGLRFTVTDTGDVQDAKVIEQNGSSRQASEALEAIRSARYRPKFVNGEPVDTQGVVNREVFKIRKTQPGDEKQS